MGKFNVYGAGNKRTIHVKNEKHKDDIFFFNPIFAGVHENNLTPPPSKSHV